VIPLSGGCRSERGRERETVCKQAMQKSDIESCKMLNDVEIEEQYQVCRFGKLRQ
jgi:hypothetical protein